MCRWYVSRAVEFTRDTSRVRRLARSGKHSSQSGAAHRPGACTFRVPPHQAGQSAHCPHPCSCVRSSGHLAHGPSRKIHSSGHL